MTGGKAHLARKADPKHGKPRRLDGDVCLNIHRVARILDKITQSCLFST